jgi:hypothetical protein
MFSLSGITNEMDGGTIELTTAGNYSSVLWTQFDNFSLVATDIIANSQGLGLGTTYTVSVIGGTGIGQTNHVHSFNLSGPIATFTFDDAWGTAPDSTSFLLFSRPDLSYEGAITMNTATTFTFNGGGGVYDSALSSTDNYYVGWTVAIQNHLMSGYVTSLVTSYNGSTKQFTIYPGNLDSSSTVVYLSRPDLTFAGFISSEGGGVWTFLYSNDVTTHALSSVNNFYNGCAVNVTSGTGAGGSSYVVSSNGSNGTVTLLTPLVIDTSSVIQLQREYVYSYIAGVSTAPTTSTFTLLPNGLYQNSQNQLNGYAMSLVYYQDYYTGCVAFVEDGTGKGTTNLVTGYSSGGTFTVQNTWTIDSTSVIALFRPMVEVYGTVNQVGPTNSFKFVSTVPGLSNTDNFYNGLDLRVVSGTGSGSTNTVSDYVGSTQIFTTTTPWNIDTTSTVSLTQYSSFKDIFLFGLPANHIIVSTKISTLTSFSAGVDVTSSYPNRVFVVLGEEDLFPLPEQAEDIICTSINSTYGIANLTIPAGVGDTYQYGSFLWFTTSAPGTATYARNALPPGTISSPLTIGAYCVPTRLDAHDIIARFCILDWGDNSDQLAQNILKLETEWNFNSNVTSGAVEITIQYMAI